MEEIILLYLNPWYLYFRITMCNSVLYLSKWVAVRIGQVKAIKWWTSTERLEQRGTS